MIEITSELVRQAQAGDEQACRRIIERLHRPVIGTVYRFLGSRFASEAEDIAQEIFLKLFRAIDRFDHDRGVKFTTWVYTFVRNHCFDILKKRRLPTVSMSPGDDDGPRIEARDESTAEPGENLENSELGSKIEEALEGLGADQRLAFVLREYEGLDYASIAEVMQVTEGTVKSRLHRAKEALRERLSPYLRAGA